MKITDPTEEWRPVVGFPDYVVSSLGRVASIKRQQFKVLAGGKTDTGYRNVLLYNNGARSGHRVHVLVAAAFYGPRPEGLEIRHLDGDRLNNAVANLRYGTREENEADRRRHRGFLLIVGEDPVPARYATGRRPERVRLDRTARSCGHEKSPENTYVYPDGRSACRRCKTAGEVASRRRRALRTANVSTAVAA